MKAFLLVMGSLTEYIAAPNVYIAIQFYQRETGETIDWNESRITEIQPELWKNLIFKNEDEGREFFLSDEIALLPDDKPRILFSSL